MTQQKRTNNPVNRVSYHSNRKRSLHSSSCLVNEEKFEDFEGELR